MTKPQEIAAASLAKIDKATGVKDPDTMLIVEALFIDAVKKIEWEFKRDLQDKFRAAIFQSPISTKHFDMIIGEFSKLLKNTNIL